MSIREQIKQAVAGPVKTELVSVPGYPDIWVRKLTGDEFDHYEQACVAAGEKAGEKRSALACRHLLIRMAACDELGVPAFGPADDDFLKSLPSDFAIAVARRASKLGGFGGGDDPGNG